VSHHNTNAIGSEAEQRALRFLERKGLRLLTRNYRCRQGEIDLVMREGNFLVFVEVRYRKHNRYGSPAESVTAKKQQRILSAAARYLLETAETKPRPCRFDVVAISAEGENIDWIRDAFQAVT
jgi:putative endonuclease